MLERGGLSGAVFSRQFLVSWIAAGLEDVILRGMDSGFVWALVTPEDAYLVSSSTEAVRL